MRNNNRTPQMQILMKIDQAAALKRGLNAPSSTERVDVDPALLTQTERDVLAAVVVDGYDATKRGLRVDGDEWWSPPMQANNGRPYGNGSPTPPLLATRPGLDGLREAIANAVARVTEVRARVADATAIAEAEMADRTRAALASVSEQPMTLRMNAEGKLSEWASVVCLDISVPSLPLVDVVRVDVKDADMIYVYPGAEYDAAKTEIEAQKAARIEAALPDLRAQLAQALAANAETEAEAEAAAKRRDAGIREWVATHAPALLARYDEGLLPVPELDCAVRSWLFRPLDSFARRERTVVLASAVGHDDDCVEADVVFATDEAPTLTSDEYAGLVALRSVLTSSWAVKAVPGVRIAPRRLTGRCDNCVSDEVTATYVHVSTTWQGRSYSRKYAL